MNRRTRWRGLLVSIVVMVGLLFALPNFYGADPALQVSNEDGRSVSELTLDELSAVLDRNRVEYLEPELEQGVVEIRFQQIEEQFRSSELLKAENPDHVVAFTHAPRTPRWLEALGLKPMSLGLDLQGGVHFLYQVDLESAINQVLETQLSDLRQTLRVARVPHVARLEEASIEVTPDRLEDAIVAREAINRTQSTFLTGNPMGISEAEIGGRLTFVLTLSENQIRERQDAAIQTNIVTLRNRVNALGVTEPVVQRQGFDRILVQLPGMQDPAQAERILGATATLEWRLQDVQNSPGSILRTDTDGRPILLSREVIASGAQLADASFGYEEGRPAVFVRLDSQGAERMLEATQANLGKPLAVLFIEDKPRVVEQQDGTQELRTRREETVIFVGDIAGVFSNSFRISGGLTALEAQDLALLLRSGNLAAPIVKIEERTIGPSLGQENIDRGRTALSTGFLLVVAFMLARYRILGLVASAALVTNLLLIVALLSLLQASLTLPGIAGIVLTVGMAVDANVLIFERIREELRNGNSNQASIRVGYDKAFSTIADANATTLIAALVLFAFGTGAIRGFAVTLGLGILTSMFTAILGTRTIIDLMHSGRPSKALSIGGTRPASQRKRVE